MFNKDTFRLIKRTFKRFLTLLLMVLIGSGFMVGLMSSSPMLEKSVDTYNDNNNLMDMQIYSSFGFCNEDIEAILNTDGVKDVYGSKFIDAYAKTDESNSFVTRISELETDINKFELVEGRMPNESWEALVLEGSNLGGQISIGSIIDVYNDDDISENLKYTRFKIVGKVKSPLYLARTSEVSTFKNLSLETVIFVDNHNFLSEYYTTLYLTADGALNAMSYSDKYDDIIEEVKKNIEDTSLIQQNYLKDDLINEANKEIKEAEETLEKEVNDANKEIYDAQIKLNDGYQELKDNEKKLEDGKKEIADNEKLIADNKQKLIDGKKELEAGWDAYYDGRKELNEGLDQIEAQFGKPLNEAISTMNGANNSLNNIKTNLCVLDDFSNLIDDNSKSEDIKYLIMSLETENEEEFNQNKEKLIELLKKENSELDNISNKTNSIISSLEDEDLQYLLKMMPQDEEIDFEKLNTILGYAKDLNNVFNNDFDANIKKIENINFKVDEAEKQTLNVVSEFIGNYYLFLNNLNDKVNDKDISAIKELIIDEIDSGLNTISSYLSLMDDAKEGLSALAEARLMLVEAQEELEKGEKELEDGEKKLIEAKDDIIEGEKTLKDGWDEYYSGINELESAKKELEDEVEKAEIDIAKAKQDLTDLPEAEWTILDRKMNYSHALFDGTIDQMASIGNVFPLLFFLVAALVCLTTMTRLIDEERGQIGVFSALGFSKAKIQSKYLIYAFLASLVGALIGIPLGMAIYPTIIYNTWGLMYNLPKMQFALPIHIFLLGVFAFAILMMTVTYFVTNDTLKSKPAELMRPKAPKEGKQVFLEKIDFIWKRLSFLTKVSIRNIFRYKSRFFMTIIGVAGCTSLLVLGFGIKDSIADIIDIQYGEIFIYNEAINLEDSDYLQDIKARIEKEDNVSEVASYMQYSSKVYKDDEPVITVQVFDENEINDVIKLRERETKNELRIDEGVVISEKFAKSNDIHVGDTITIESINGIRGDVQVSGICEMYFEHYLFINNDLYSDTFNEKVHHDKIATISNNTQGLKEMYENYEGIETIVDFSGVVDNFETMIGALDFIILVIIIAAGSLALVVLINLSEVNISERIREIATFKVLGFYNREVSMYIFKELLFLTILGALLGLPLGKIEHTFVMQVIDMEMIMYGVNISSSSYLYAFMITLIFTAIVFVIMSRSLKKVKMVESLKSVE